ncbi:MAG: S41 family peptidase [Flavobacteriales bacterium]|nr:S41 family peptidase [Flavobacteriales bacterium]
MHQRKLTVWVLLPLLLAAALATGLYLGSRFQARDPHAGVPGMPGLFFLRGASPSDKLGEVIDLLDRQYVDSVRTDELVDGVLQDLLQRLDPHSYYISAAELQAAQEPLEGSFEGIGVEFAIQRDTIVVIAPVEGGPSASKGIRAGDRILKADTVELAGRNITNDVVMRTLRGRGGSEVTLKLARAGRKEPFEVTVTRGKIPINSVASALVTPDGTGFIKLTRFAKTTHEELLNAAAKLEKQGMKRLVLDLRGNGGGYLDAAIDIADEFLPKGRMIVYTEGRTHPRRDFEATANGTLEDIPLAVLIDEGSASASEIIAGAVQDNDRGVIVGRRSFGKGLVQEHIPLPDRSAVRITTARYHTPSGRCIQRPYGEGIDYRDDLEERFDHGELLNRDSIRVDSSQVFTTLKGRKVYGNGGIMPDVFVPADTSETSGYLSELFFSGALNQYAFDVADRDRRKLEALGGAPAFRDRYTVGPEQLAGLDRYAQEQGIRADPAGQARSRNAIALRLKAGIARNIWGMDAFYSVMLEADSAFSEARKALP